MDKEILQNLKDANCDTDLISKFFSLEGNLKGQLRLLSIHRKNLLFELHKSQKYIDCLDYLIFNIEQMEGK